MERIRKLLEKVDYEGLRSELASNPALANEGIAFDETNTTKAHPLHRICDGVFSGIYTDDQAAELAKIFLEYGANVDGVLLKEKQDTPLIAAASLGAENVGLLYMERGANIHHGGCHGGTALHWAAWCGWDKLVRRLIQEKAEINRRCIDFESTPLFWAIHGFKNVGKEHVHHQEECARLLINAGADKNIPNKEGTKAIELLDPEDETLRQLLAE
jgi:uncharacterized protein